MREYRAREFVGTPRFEVVRRLGEGATGIVYEVLDKERDARVALKTLTRLEAAALFRFKREFRALADVTHPNLVELHELVADGELWFFTMGLVDGADLLEYVRPVRPGEGERALDLPRLRSALEQLAEGLTVLHAAGKLHRDIKPSNVLVARDGRVVIVDFGIAVDLSPGAAGAAVSDEIAGTPAYMAPEQGAGEPLTPAADWYSVGVVLFRALTGQLPFSGGVMDVISEKLLHEAPRPSEVAPGVPPDLDALCVELLRIEPAERPTGDEIIARLTGAIAARDLVPLASGSYAAWTTATATAIVGREGARSELAAGLGDARGGKLSITIVQGASGMGKTAIVRDFLERSQLHGGAAVFSGRCYQRESLPYKAFDSVIDALTAYLVQLDADEQAHLVPPDLATLARIFPVLQRVPHAVESARRGDDADEHSARKRAFGALRDLLAKLAELRPVVVFVDDLQWGDLDSVALLRALVAPPDPPPIAIVLAFRGEEAATSPTLRELFAPRTTFGAAGVVRRVTLDALDRVEATELAASMLGPELASDGELVARIVSEAGGNPFFLGELARHVQAAPGHAGDLRLGAVLHARLASLPRDALRLLECIAVAGRPISQAIVLHAAGLAREKRLRALSALRKASHVRAQSGRGGDLVECFHDRIREAAVAGLSSEALVARHRELARALARDHDSDPEALVVHYQAANMGESAREHAIAAARKTHDALAFDRAVDFYRVALSLLAPDDPRAKSLHVELGDALASAGRGSEAANAYIAAKALAEPSGRLALQRRAAEELLFSGRVDQGLDALAEVLAPYGVRLSPARWRALVSLVFMRMWLAVRGMSFTIREARDVPAARLTKLDVFFSVSAGLSMADNVIAAWFATGYLLACLEVGEPFRLCRAICLELAFASSEGRPVAKKVDRALALARSLAQRSGRSDVLALVDATTGLADHFRGDWVRGYTRLSRALTTYREHAGAKIVAGEAHGAENYSARFEVVTFRYFRLSALVQLGRFDALASELAETIRDARERGDLYSVTNLQMGDTNVCWLASDEPDEAARLLDESLAGWSRRVFSVQHWWQLQGHVLVALYRGDALAAQRRIDAMWWPLQRSLLMRIQFLRIRAYGLRARAALVALVTTARPNARALVALAERGARRIFAERLPFADAEARLIEAAVLQQRGDRDAAGATLRAALAGFESESMAVHAEIARRRLGELEGGVSGAELRISADARLRKLGVRSPARMTAMLAPAVGASEHGDAAGDRA